MGKKATVTEENVLMRDILLTKMKFSAGQTFGATVLNEMQVNEMYDFMASQLYVTLSTKVLAHEIASDYYEIHEERNVEIPSNWWEMFKRDHFSLKYLDKHPIKVKYEVVHFRKTIHFSRMETYPMSSMLIQKNHQYLKTMGSPIIKDVITEV